MALQVIGAGFGRTGTESMKRALEMLGFGPCYHMYEVYPDPARYKMWQDILDGEITPDWDHVFDGFQATVDWPACTYWRELSAQFPEAKILLTIRSSESWLASMENTILPALRDPKHEGTIGHKIKAKTFGNRVALEDHPHVVEVFNRHNAEVQAAFGPERLLTYELGSGWEPLCAFLGVDVPDTPYPRGNDAADFHARDKELTAKRKAAQDGGA